MLPLSLRAVCSAMSWSQHSSWQNPEALEGDSEGNAGLNKGQAGWERAAKVRHGPSRGRR